MLRTILALLWFRDTVRSETQVLAVALAAAGAVVAIAPVPAADTAEPLQRHTLFVGVDTSGSFRHAGDEDAMTFLACYLYRHVNGLGGLAKHGALFVANLGGQNHNVPKGHRPILDLISIN